MSQAKDEYGQMSPAYSIVGQDGKEVGRFSTPQIASILGADDMIAEEERRLSMRKTGAEIGLAEARSGAARDAGSASRASAGKYAAEAAGVRLENEGIAALPAAERARKTTSAGSPSSLEKEATFMVQIGAAPDLRTAAEMIRADGNLRHVLGLMSQDPQAITNPEQAYERAQKLVNQPTGGMFPRVPSHGADAQGRPATDDATELDLRRFLQGGR